MKITETKLEGVVIVEPRVFGDHRGFFMESWSQKKFEEAGLHYNFVQDNHSSSTVKGTLRGIHFQRGEMAQAKLVRCHGFVTLTDDVEFLYKADNFYAPEADGGIRWNDPELNIDWGTDAPILSDKDANAPFLKDAVTGF